MLLRVLYTLLILAVMGIGNRIQGWASGKGAGITAMGVDMFEEMSEWREVKFSLTLYM